MAGNTVHVQGNYIDVHDNEVVNLSVEKATVRMQGSEGMFSAAASERTAKDVPDSLTTAAAEAIWARLRAAGLIVADGYDLASGVSANKAAYIADRMAAKLNIKRMKWKLFQQLWGINNMAQLAGAWQQTGKLPPQASEIDELV